MCRLSSLNFNNIQFHKILFIFTEIIKVIYPHEYHNLNIYFYGNRDNVGLPVKVRICMIYIIYFIEVFTYAMYWYLYFCKREDYKSRILFSDLKKKTNVQRLSKSVNQRSFFFQITNIVLAWS